MIRLRADGYAADFSATADGRLRCGDCSTIEDPENMSVAVTERFEGDSNPDDESILLALVCGCGSKGQFTAAFGPDTPRADAAVLVRLSRTTGPTDG
ncbi:MAG: hypothetical protein ACXIVQ_09010 [Acidimicrobiales bacterium]